MKITEAFDLYIVERVREKRLSYNTEDNYRQARQAIVKCLGDMPIETLTFDYVRKWTNDMHRRGIGAGTERCYKSKLKNVLKLTNKRRITSFDLDDIELPRMPRKLPRYITAKDARKLLEVASTPREKAIIDLFFCTGVRVSELVALNRSHIEGDTLFIENGKGAKDRRVPLNQNTKARIEEYLATRTDNNAALFYSHKKGRLGVARVQKLIQQIRTDAGITKPVSPHILRHSFGTDLHSNGMDIRYVQHFMGHEHIATTQIYTHIVDKIANQVFAECQTAL